MLLLFDLNELLVKILPMLGFRFSAPDNGFNVVDGGSSSVDDVGLELVLFDSCTCSPLVLSISLDEDDIGVGTKNLAVGPPPGFGDIPEDAGMLVGIAAPLLKVSTYLRSPVKL